MVIKKALKIIGKIFLWTTVTILSLLVVVCVLFTFPKVQTFAAQKAADFLAKQLETDITIEKLYISWDLDVVIENIQICDRQGNNMISAKKIESEFPQFESQSKRIIFRNTTLTQADVFICKLKDVDEINMRFFINFFKKEDRKSKTTILFPNAQLIDSRFNFRNENLFESDREGLWNYKNIILNHIDLKMDEIKIVNKKLFFQIRELDCVERSGFTIEDFTGQLQISSTGIYCDNASFSTPNQTNIHVDFGFKYDDYPSLRSFVDSVSFDSKLKKSVLNFKDLAYFTPAFKGMTDIVTVNEAEITGPVSNLLVSEADIAFSPQTNLKADVKISGLPDKNNLNFAVNAKEINVQYNEIENIKLPNDTKITLPEVIKKLHNTSISGDFTGNLKSFYSNHIEVKTPLGNIACSDFSLKDSNRVPIYKGNFDIIHLQLNHLIDYKDVESINASGFVKGEEFDFNKITASLECNVSSVRFRQKNISNIDIFGNIINRQILATVNAKDKDLNVTLNSNLDFGALPYKYLINGTLDTVNLSKFDLFRPDSNALIRTDIDLNLAGNTLEEMEGTVQLANFCYWENDSSFPISSLNLSVENNAEKRNISLQLPFLKANLSGNFTYKEVVGETQNLLHAYFPSLIKKKISVHQTSNHYFNATLSMQQHPQLLKKLVPLVGFENGLDLKFEIDNKYKSTYLLLNIPSFSIKNQIFDTIRIVASDTLNNHLKTTFFCQSYRSENDTLSTLTDINLNALAYKDSISFEFNALGADGQNMQDLHLRGIFGFTSPKSFFCLIDKGSLIFESSRYILDDFNYFSFSSDSISIQHFGIYDGDKKFTLYGAVSSVHEKKLIVDFQKIQLEDFEMIFNRLNFSLAGELTGDFVLTSGQYGYNIHSDLTIDNFIFNGVPVGFLKGQTRWQNNSKRLTMSASLSPIGVSYVNYGANISGYFDPQKKIIDIGGDINHFDIKTLERYMTSFASQIGGKGSGYLSFSGPISEAKLAGKIHLEEGVLGVDFLKTTYYLEECDIDFIDTGFIIQNVAFKDMNDNKGVIDGKITHRRLKDWEVDLKIDAQNLMVLNTTRKDNDLFFGKAFGSGRVNIKGKQSNILISGLVTTEKLTDVSIMLDWNSSVNKNSFITFVDINETKKTDSIRKDIIKNSGVSIDLAINATPNAKLAVFLDPSIGGKISGTGAGNIRMTLSPETDFQLFGSYMLENGTFDLALGQLLTRSFKLEQGGTILWNGDPTEGQISVRASYAAKVSIANLVTEEALAETRPVSVNNILSLNGNLLNPDINFGLELKDVDEVTKSIVFNAIDTTNKDEMIKQTFSILMLGMFSTDNVTNSSDNLLRAGAYSLSELISYHLNNWISSQNVNFGFVYRPGDGNTLNDEYNINVSTSFLDNRLIIQGSLDIYGDMNDPEKQAIAGNVVGDIIVEYKLTKDGSLRLKAFNIANYQDILATSTSTAPYSQGLGLSFTKDFHGIKRNKKREKKKRSSAK